MYMAKFNLFRLNIPTNIWYIILVVALVIVVMHRCNREGFGTPLDEVNNQKIKTNYGKNAEVTDLYTPYESNTCGPNNLNKLFFDTTKFDPKCCTQTSLYSGNSSCPCMCPEQLNYLNHRGGNRSEFEEY